MHYRGVPAQSWSFNDVLQTNQIHNLYNIVIVLHSDGEIICNINYNMLSKSRNFIPTQKIEQHMNEMKYEWLSQVTAAVQTNQVRRFFLKNWEIELLK